MNGLVAAPPQIIQQQQPVSAATPVWSGPHTNPNQPQLMTTAAFGNLRSNSFNPVLLVMINIEISLQHKLNLAQPS